MSLISLLLEESLGTLYHRTHDPPRELFARRDREDLAATVPTHRCREGLPRNRIRDTAEPRRRPPPEVVDPIVGVRRQSDLFHPQPNLLGFGPYRDAPPRLQDRIRHDLVAGIVPASFIWGHAPTVTDHIRRLLKPRCPAHQGRYSGNEAALPGRTPVRMQPHRRNAVQTTHLRDQSPPTTCHRLSNGVKPSGSEPLLKCPEARTR
jgi:hypothetical protein